MMKQNYLDAKFWEMITDSKNGNLHQLIQHVLQFVFISENNFSMLHVNQFLRFEIGERPDQ